MGFSADRKEASFVLERVAFQSVKVLANSLDEEFLLHIGMVSNDSLLGVLDMLWSHQKKSKCIGI